MRALAVLLLALGCCLGAEGRVLRILEPSTGLAYSLRDVIQSSEATRRAFLQDMQGKNSLGCAVYCARVATVWNTLLPVLRYQVPGGTPPLQLLVVRSEDVDALSFPDGTIVISEAFITRMALEPAQIAFVLAHEATHVLLQHERQTLTSMLALMPSRIQGTPGDLYVEMEFRYGAIGDALSFVSRQIEFEADEFGLQLAAMAGFTPDEQLRFVAQSAETGEAATAASTHPAMAERLERLQQLLPLARRLYEFGRQ